MKDHEKYLPYLIKEYQHWNFYLHQNQSSLGRSYLWTKREVANTLLDITFAETVSLQLALLDVTDAINRVFQPDFFNYEFLGNEIPHLHCHIIPRYASPREFAGMKFFDKTYGRRFMPDTLKYKDELLFAIRDRLKESFAE